MKFFDVMFCFLIIFFVSGHANLSCQRIHTHPHNDDFAFPEYPADEEKDADQADFEFLDEPHFDWNQEKMSDQVIYEMDEQQTVDMEEISDCLPPDCSGYPGDRDCDTIVDSRDNCPDCFNPCQDNMDGDDKGDACDDFCDEVCIGKSCMVEGIAGCNCSICPENFACLGDSSEPSGICPGSGVYSFCAPSCLTDDDCPPPLVCASIAGKCYCIWNSDATNPCEGQG